MNSKSPVLFIKIQERIQFVTRITRKHEIQYEFLLLENVLKLQKDKQNNPCFAGLTTSQNRLSMTHKLKNNIPHKADVLKEI